MESSCFECTKLIGPNFITVRRLKRIYCQECWIHHCNFRFRKRLFELARPEKGSRRSSNSFGQPENVLIYYDGSNSALALLHLIRDALRSATEDRSASVSADSSAPLQKILHLPFKFTILYINDETSNKSKEDLIQELKLLREWQVATRTEYGLDFPIILSSLELSIAVLLGQAKTNENLEFWRTIPSQFDENLHPEAMGANIDLNLFPFTVPFNSTLNSRLHLVADNIKTKTSRKDFLLELRENLVVFIGKEMNFKNIFVSEEQTAMAIKMFSMMSLGRGAQLAEQMSLATQIQGLKLARPLMDLALDDLRDYMECLNWEKRTTMGNITLATTNTKEAFTSTSLPIGKVVGKRSKEKSIEDQCNEFITDLQQGYPSTVPTLTRIGAKLQPSASLAKDFGAREEREIEQEDDAKPGSELEEGNKTSGESGSDRSNFSTLTAVCTFCKKNRNDTEDQESLELSLCYGCTNILRDMIDFVDSNVVGQKDGLQLQVICTFEWGVSMLVKTCLRQESATTETNQNSMQINRNAVI